MARVVIETEVLGLGARFTFSSGANASSAPVAWLAHVVVGQIGGDPAIGAGRFALFT